MNYWKNEYFIARKNIPELKQQIKGVIVGFNVNLDKIINVNPDLLGQILNQFESIDQIISEPSPSMINNIDELICSLVNAIRHGKADESQILSKEVGEWIERNFNIRDVQIGGQAGIMSNLLRRMNIEQVLLSLPSFNLELIDLLDSSIFTVIGKNEKIRIGSITDITTENEYISHYIFEFKEGDYSIGEETITCTRSNRFIASLDFVNPSIKINENFRRYSTENINNFSSAIISGFHLINPKITQKSHLELLKRVKSLLNGWKKINSDLTLHLEMAAIKDVQLSKLIIEKIFPIIDRLGLNEQELLAILETISPTMREKIRAEMNITNLFDGLSELFKSFPKLSIFLHCLGYYLVISPPLDKKYITKRKESVLLSSLFAAVKAKEGEIKTKDDIIHIPVVLNSIQLKQIKLLENHLNQKYCNGKIFADKGIFNHSSFTLIYIPTIVIKNPKNLVGLGDTISLIASIFESNY